MGFQSTVATAMGFGVVGDLFLDGPFRGQPGIIDSVGTTPAFNRVGRAFTQVAAADGHCTVGGTIGNGTPFFGILANPKVYPLLGTSSGTLAPSLDLAQYAEGEFVTMGEIIVTYPAACNIGDLVDFVAADGSLATRAPSSSFTIAISTTTATITGFVAGGAPIGIGTVLSAVGIAPETIVTALGSGTGGNGTYTVNNSQSLSAIAGTGSSQPASGNVAIPRATVSRYNLTGAGTGVLRLTN